MARFVVDTNPTNVEVGDVVTLKSGGPGMTVLGLCDECNTVEVGWFNFAEGSGFEFHAEAFPVAAFYDEASK